MTPRQKRDAAMLDFAGVAVVLGIAILAAIFLIQLVGWVLS